MKEYERLCHNGISNLPNSLKIGRNGPMLSTFWKIIIPRNVYPNKLYVKYVIDFVTNDDIYVTHNPFSEC